MTPRPKPRSRYGVDGRTVDGRPVRILTRELEAADKISEEISRGVRVRNPSGEDFVVAMEPAVLLAIGIDPPEEKVDPSSYTVYSPGSGGHAANVQKFTVRVADRALELEKLGTLIADYDLVERAFGTPVAAGEVWDDGESQVVWLVKFGKDNWATIYDYETALPPELNDVWSIAGRAPLVLDQVMAAVTKELSSFDGQATTKTLKQKLIR